MQAAIAAGLAGRRGTGAAPGSQIAHEQDEEVALMTRWIQSGLLVAVLLASGCQGTPGVKAQATEAQQQVRQQLGPVTELDTATAFRLSHTFRAAADRALPAVVYIATMREQRAGQRQQHPPIPDELRRFFQFPDGFEMEPGPQQGAGSGFIIDGDGHIMTNHHVVTGATRIMVRLVDGREYDATLVGSDAATDVAIIRIEPRRGETLPVAMLGSADETRIGDWVIALGNPMGFNFTVTAGIISAKGRQLRRGAATGAEGAPPLEAYLQTDAAINPGNSGGPLVDLLGRVVGMNTAISARNFVGHGFAVPIDLAQRVASDLMAHGHVRRPRIGVSIQDVTGVDAEVYGLPSIRGAHITAVEAGQPAAQAGLRPGDVVLSIGGREIGDATDLTTTLARRQPGEQVDLVIWRDGRQQTVRVRLGEFPRPDQQRASADAAPRPAERIGFSVRAVTAAEAARLGLPREDGLIIDQVAQYGPAAGRVEPRTAQGANLLRSINGRAVRTEAEFEAAVRRLNPGDAVSLRFVHPQLGEMAVNYRVR
jgi:serine protease Do